MSNSQQNLSYEEASKRLEELVMRLENSELKLEDALEYFEEAVSLVNYCRTLLNAAEQRLAVLTENEAGDLKLEPLSFPEDVK